MFLVSLSSVGWSKNSFGYCNSSVYCLFIRFTRFEFSLFLAVCCLSSYLVFRRGAWFELYDIISCIAGVIGFWAWGGCCWSENTRQILFTILRMIFLSIGFQTIDDKFFYCKENRKETILFRLEKDAVLVMVNIVMEGWRRFRSDRSPLRWIG